VNLRNSKPLRLHLWIGRFIFPHKALFILFMQIQSAEEIIDTSCYLLHDIVGGDGLVGNSYLGCV
jgi:hypothetical protein